MNSLPHVDIKGATYCPYTLQPKGPGCDLVLDGGLGFDIDAVREAVEKNKADFLKMLMECWPNAWLAPNASPHVWENPYFVGFIGKGAQGTFLKDPELVYELITEALSRKQIRDRIKRGHPKNIFCDIDATDIFRSKGHLLGGKYWVSKKTAMDRGLLEEVKPCLA